MTVTTDLADRPAPGTGRTRPHLLVADDVPVLRRLLAEALGAEGFDVTAVTDGMAALNAYPEVGLRAPPPAGCDSLIPGFPGSRSAEMMIRNVVAGHVCPGVPVEDVEKARQGIRDHRI
jgi:hypothetical protein